MNETGPGVAGFDPAEWSLTARVLLRSEPGGDEDEDEEEEDDSNRNDDSDDDGDDDEGYSE